MLSDKEIALKEAARVLDADDAPFFLSINHDVRSAACRSNKPRTGACPLIYDWSHANLVGIKVEHRLEAKRWVMQALELGYTVARLRPNYEPMATGQIEFARRLLADRERRAAMTPKERKIDDEVPF